MIERKGAAPPSSHSIGISYTGMVIGICVAVFILATWIALKQSPRPNPFTPATTQEKLFFPYEENAVMRLPTVIGTFNDIFIVPGSRDVWAVGNGGLILVSRDNGQSWEQQKFPFESEAIKPPEMNQKAALGRFNLGVQQAHAAEQKVLKTDPGSKVDVKQQFQDIPQESLKTDPGSTIDLRQQSQEVLQQSIVPEKRQETVEITRPQITPETPPDLHSIFFVDENTGWITGSSGTILSTMDGGRSWKQEAVGTDVPLFSIHFIDQAHGWAAGENGTILSTTDGGRSWTPEISDTYDPLFSIHFIDQAHGWAAGNNGTILSTKDRGRTWNIDASGTNKRLTSIHFIDQTYGCASGGGGTILSTADGGRTWNIDASGTDGTLYSIHFIDQAHGWAAGWNGTILSTTDGGRTWTPETSGVDGTLFSIHFIDQAHGWAVGDNGTILSSVDGGRTWKPSVYRRLPAPWYWALCLLLILVSLFVLNRRGQPEQAGETVADLLASDRPLEAGDPDPLNLNTISSGLARFIANRNTEPPLTIAVTGEWGTGKSSLMNLLYHDLKQRRFHPVWFNAWHHQKGEQLLASLYANIRQQAVPPLWHPTGIIFRLRLLFRRGRRNWLTFGLLAFFFFAAWPFLADLILSIAGSTTSLVEALIEKDMESVGQIFSLAQLKSAIQGNWINALIASPAVAAALRGIRAFGLSPQQLLAFGTVEGGGKRGLDPGARTRFAQEFENVSASLDLGAMVIFIDDLDRCSKENVVEILETINFLAVSGRCFIILGMARQWVETCVALQFKELAEETGNEKDSKSDGYAHRRRFAKQYLEKLINIEVPVPVPSSDGAKALLAPPTPAPAAAIVRMTAGTGKAIRKYAPILCLIVLALLSWYLKDILKHLPLICRQHQTKNCWPCPHPPDKGSWCSMTAICGFR